MTENKPIEAPQTEAETTGEENPQKESIGDLIESVRADMGRKYPAEYLSCLAADVLETIQDRLKDAGLSKDINQLIDILVMLERLASRKEGGVLTEQDAAWLGELVPQAVQLTWDSGGTFYSADGSVTKSSNEPSILRYRNNNA